MHAVNSQTDTTRLIQKENAVTNNNTVTANELEDNEESQDISGLLQSSEDIFTSTAGYNFGPAGFRVRGFESEYTTVMINGIVVNDQETGRAFWSTWGGLNDVTRNQTVIAGLGLSDYAFGDIGGMTNISTRASLYRKETKFTYSLSNRSYRKRAMFTHSTGMMKNGWAYTISGSRRWSEEGYAEGTFYDGWSYFLAIEKKLNEKHSLGLVAFAAPTKRGMAGIVTQENYDLAGTNYYNPYWGFQAGEKRNSRVSKQHTPMFILSDYLNFSKTTSLTTQVSYAFGHSGTTALDWYDAADPRPDYYRNLPSYWKDDPVLFNYYTQQWEDETFRQLNFDHFYFANRKNLYTIDDAEGIIGNNVTGNLSKYIIEERRYDYSRFVFNSLLKHTVNKNVTVSGGLTANIFKGYRFKVVEDLLGGDFYINFDKFAEREPLDTLSAENDLNNPNRVIKEGDRFGYDYTANINNYSLFGQSDFTYAKADFYLAAMAGMTNFWRTGNMKNGRFPDHSYGDSEKQNFTNYGVKGGFTYKMTGRHFLDFNTFYISKAPSFRNSYISPRTRDYVVDGLENEKGFAFDASYIYRSPFLKTRLTFYHVTVKDQIFATSFYHEELRTFVNYSMTGVDKIHTGAELGADIKLSPTFNANIVAARGDYYYNSRPQATITEDNNSAVIATNRTVYLKNFKIGDMAQTALTAGIKYNSPKYWFLGINANYFDDIYLEPNPDRRTVEAVEGLVSDDPQWGALMTQEKLSSAYTIDLFGGKSWKIDKYYIAVNLNIGNILDNQDFATGGFEQYRFEQKDIEKFPPKFRYLYGRTYYLNVNIRI